MPDQKEDQSTLDVSEKTLTGSEEIRSTLETVERLRKEGHTEARVVTYEHSDESNVRVILRSVKELENHLESRMRRTLFEGVSERLELEITPKSPADDNDVH